MVKVPRARAAGFFVLRAPVLPFETFASLADSPWERLRELLATNAVLREALFIAAPDLHDAALEADPPEPLRRALMRYVSRMSARATPFGLLAGVALGKVGRETNLALDGLERARRHVRLDHGYLARLLEECASRPEIRESLRCTPNETLYAYGGELRYTESRVEQEGVHSYRLASLASDEPLLTTLLRARDGATLETLARALSDEEEEIAFEDAQEYVSELLAQDVLRHDLSPAVTGGDALEQTLRGLAAKGKSVPMLDDARRGLRDVADQPLGITPDRYHALAATLPEAESALRRGMLVQVDLGYASPALTIDKRVVDDMLNGATVLHRLFGRTRDVELEAFRERFRERFDRREIPFLAALDPDAGIAFGGVSSAGTPLVENLDLPSRPPAETFERTAVDELLMRKLHEALSRGVREVELTRAELDALHLPDPRPLPATFAMHGALTPNGVRVESLTGASGARLLGRFCAALPELEPELRRYLDAERGDDVVVAEVVHVPEGRTGNVVAIPTLYDYELPLGGRSGAPVERQLALSDLRLSVVGDELVLRSEKLNRRVMPRLTSAQNYLTQVNLPMYRFLGKLQGDLEAAIVTWSWSFLAGAPFLPQVRFGNCVLTRALWTIPSAQLASASAIAETRVSLGLPRFVELERLAVDLDNAVSIEELVRASRKGPYVALREFPALAELVARTPAGAHVHEIVVPMVNPAPRSRARPRTASAVSVRRRFAPGSEWTYVKIYSGTASADGLLTDVVAPVVRDLIGQGAADRWFFARYADPDPHLRVRVHGDAMAAMRVWSAALEPHLEERVHRMQFDTYEREVERYGGPQAIGVAEELFHHDSDAAVRLIALELPPEERWRAALASVHALLEELTDDVDERQRIAHELRLSFAGEFGIDSATRRDIGMRFRNLAPELTVADAAVNDILQKRGAAMHDAVQRLRALRERNELTVRWDRLVISCMHMCVNRVIAEEARVHELVMYDLLERLYLREKERCH